MDDIQEAQELHDEIADVISQPVGFGADVDEVGLPTTLSHHTYKRLISQSIRFQDQPLVADADSWISATAEWAVCSCF